MTYTYTTFSAALAAALAVELPDDDFTALLPTVIDDAEQRIYRELDLMTANVTVPGVLTANSRTFLLPQTAGHVLVVDAINIFSAPGVRFSPPVKMVTRDVLDYFWPNEAAPSASSVPMLAARANDDSMLLGPAPGADWNCEVICTIRPAPLSVSNPTTFLTQYLSDLFFKCCMADANGVILKNYGAQSTDPQQAVSWETAFQIALASAKSEELRKQYVSSNSPLPASAKA